MIDKENEVCGACVLGELMTRLGIEQYTGGAIKARSIANLDSKGLGPSKKMRLGRKVVYPRKNVMAWLEAKMQ